MKAQGLKAHAANAIERYQALSLRERVLVALTALSLTWFLWAATLGGYMDTFKEQLGSTIQAMNSRLQSASAERVRLESEKASDPNARLRLERERLDAQLSHMGESLGTLLDRFVEPERMPALLEDVISHHRGLTLTRIESLPAEPMDVSPPAEDGEEVTPVWIYRHPLRIEFEGSYFDVMAYLAELERGDWEFGWRHLDYAVDKYPVARVVLEIETLSRDRSWIGV